MKPLDPIGVLAGLVLMIAAAAVAVPAAAETATKLNCKGCVGNKQLGKKAVTAKNIKPGSVTGQSIKKGSISNDKLAGNAKAGGLVFVGPILNVPIGDGTQVAFFTMSAPAAGYMVVNASGTFSFDSETSVACEITQSDGVGAAAFSANGKPAPDPDLKPFGATRTFPVTVGGTTIKLVCDSSGDVNVINAFLNATFVPNDYRGFN